MKRTLAFIIASSLLAAPLFAARVDQRQKNQQARIVEGVENGQLTARETARLERQQARLQAEKRDMRQDNGGTLTAQEKLKLNRQQNVLSKNIYRQKHDGQHQ